MADDKQPADKDAKSIALGIAAYSGASILGPLIVFGVPGYFLDQAYHGRHLILLASIIVAFLVSNVLIFRKAFAVMAELKNFHGNGKNGYDEDEEEEN